MNDFTWDQSDPLARSKGESRRANDAFRDYVFMGSGRSLRKLLDVYSRQSTEETQTEPPTKSWDTLSGWSIRLQWQARLEQWIAIDQEERQAEWRERQTLIREADFQQGQELRELGAKILAEGPNFTKTRRRFIKGDPIRGTPDREIITMAMDSNALVRVLKLGSALQRIGAEMETERTAQEISGSISGLPNADTDEMTDAQLSDALRNHSKVTGEIANRLGIATNQVGSRFDLPEESEEVSKGDFDGSEAEDT